MYCNYCGNQFNPWVFGWYDGHGLSVKNVCTRCFNRRTEMHDRYCVNCGTMREKRLQHRRGLPVLIPRQGLLCDNCNPYDPITQREKYVIRINTILFSNPEKVNILRECSCEARRKVKHHPDYSKPYDVDLLCFSCHYFEHKNNPPLMPYVAETGITEFNTQNSTTRQQARVSS